MSARIACIAGGTIYRLLDSGKLSARELPRRPTPFGQSAPIFLVEDAPAPFYLMPRHGPDVTTRIAPSRVNYRANLYALKDLGAECVLSWSAAGAIRHTLRLGHVLIPDDVMDLTSRRPTTFYEDSGLGFLRQFPVFCPALREALAGVLEEMDFPHHLGGTAAVVEGPRLETPAEVRRLATHGADVVTHTLAPDLFLARELQLCFAGACYLVNYAETGRQRQPFSTGQLFSGLTETPPAQRLTRAAESLPKMVRLLAERAPAAGATCQCHRALAELIDAGELEADWRSWLDVGAGGGSGRRAHQRAK